MSGYPLFVRFRYETYQNDLYLPPVPPDGWPVPRVGEHLLLPNGETVVVTRVVWDYMDPKVFVYLAHAQTTTEGETCDRLRAEVERLTAQIEAVRKLHVACESPVYCIGCSEAAGILDDAEYLDGDTSLYPCPTIRALDGVA